MRLQIFVFLSLVSFALAACQKASRPLLGPTKIAMPEAAVIEPEVEISRPDEPTKNSRPNLVQPSNPISTAAGPQVPTATATTPAVDAATPADEDQSGVAWVARAITLACGDEACLPAVGMLITIKSSTNARATYTYCTATLIESDQILTAGHCDLSPVGPAYFIIGEGAKKQVRAVVKVIHHEYKASKTKNALLKPDVAILGLRNPVVGIVPLKLAQSAQDAFDHLTGYVVDQLPRKDGDKISRYEVGVLHCTVNPQSYFPIEIYQAPSLFYAQDCRVVQGNSGAPFFAPQSNHIEAILQDGDSTKSLALLNNMHCLAADGKMPSDCLNVTKSSLQKLVKAEGKAGS